MNIWYSIHITGSADEHRPVAILQNEQVARDLIKSHYPDRGELRTVDVSQVVLHLVQIEHLAVTGL